MSIGVSYGEHSAAVMFQKRDVESNVRPVFDRFPIESRVRYKVLSGQNSGVIGNGKTINVSVRGVLISTEHELVWGQRLELAVSWAAQFDGKCRLQCIVRGRVLRAEPGRACVSIEARESCAPGRSS